MDAKSYVKNVLITEARNFDAVKERLSDVRNIRLIHASAGITSEIAELLELQDKAFREEMGQVVLDRVNLMEECGDILWYVGIACDALNCTDTVAAEKDYKINKIKYDYDLANSVYSTAATLAMHAGVFADLAIKKFCFYGKPFNADPLIERLTSIHSLVQALLQESGYTLEDARERNIAKLKARYGEKFSEAAALERNLDTERKILENK